MQDGHTRKLDRPAGLSGSKEFFATHRVVLVIAKGAGAGSEFSIEKDRVVLGRGPDVDLAFNDGAMSREHIAFEWVDGGIRARDLASTNGMRVNGCSALIADLKHGDSIEVGEHDFRFLLEEENRPSKAYVV